MLNKFKVSSPEKGFRFSSFNFFYIFLTNASQAKLFRENFILQLKLSIILVSIYQ